MLTVLPDENSECEPPDPIPNSEVKPLSADGSVGFPHVRVGHRQALNTKPPIALQLGVFLYEVSNIIEMDTKKYFSNSMPVLQRNIVWTLRPVISF